MKIVVSNIKKLSKIIDTMQGDVSSTKKEVRDLKNTFTQRWALINKESKKEKQQVDSVIATVKPDLQKCLGELKKL